VTARDSLLLYIIRLASRLRVSRRHFINTTPDQLRGRASPWISTISLSLSLSLPPTTLCCWAVVVEVTLTLKYKVNASMSLLSSVWISRGCGLNPLFFRPQHISYSHVRFTFHSEGRVALPYNKNICCKCFAFYLTCNTMETRAKCLRKNVTSIAVYTDWLTDWLVYSDATNVHPHWIEQIRIKHHSNTERNTNTY